MKKNTLFILIVIVLVLLGLWWIFTAQPANLPPAATSANNLMSTSDQTAAINQDLQKVDVGNYSQDLQSIDNNVNGL